MLHINTWDVQIKASGTFIDKVKEVCPLNVDNAITKYNCKLLAFYFFILFVLLYALLLVPWEQSNISHQIQYCFIVELKIHINMEAEPFLWEIAIVKFVDPLNLVIIFGE